MGLSIDYKELTEFSKEFKKIAEKDFNEFLKNFLMEMANRVLSNVKPRTPVDTGELRGSWQLGQFSGSSKNIQVEILNGAEYASFIEYGHRIVRGGTEVGWYDGRFMLKISIEEMQRQMPLRYEKMFAEFCESRGMGG